MKKYVYMKVCDFNDISVGKSFIDYYSNCQITFNRDLVVTTDHKPTKIFDGETTLVMRDNVLYARFEGINDRLYRYVKNNRYRHCSYTYRIDKSRMIYQQDGIPFRWNQKIHIYEICLTNTPNNPNTICSIVDVLPDGDWHENVQRIERIEVKGFKLDAEIEILMNEIKILNKQNQKLLMKRGIK